MHRYPFLYRTVFTAVRAQFDVFGVSLALKFVTYVLCYVPGHPVVLVPFLEQVRYSPHLQLRLERPIDSVPPHLELGVKEEGLRPRIFRRRPLFAVGAYPQFTDRFDRSFPKGG